MVQESPPIVPSLFLPTDRGPLAATVRGTYESAVRRVELTTTLKDLGVPDGEDPAATFLAAFAVLLHRYSGDDWITIGRIHSRNEPAEGSWSIREQSIDLSEDPPFRELIERVREADGNSREETVRADCANTSEGNASEKQPRFQVVYGFSNHAEASLVDRQLRAVCDSACLEVGLWVVDRGGALEALLVYDVALFDGETAARILEHFRVLLEGFAIRPQERISALPILPDTERRQIEEWGRPSASAEPPATRFLHDAFQSQAAKTPDAVAVELAEGSLTYRELDEQSNRLAHYLRRRGVGPDVLVGIALERSPELIVGLLGILKAGGAFVPFEPSHPAEQLRALVTQSDPAFVITDSRELEGVYGRRTIRLRAERDAIDAESSAAPQVEITDAHLAAVLFSSGSTGAPKAIPRAHRSLSVGSLAQSPFRLTAADVHVLKATLDSTLLVREVFWPLASGGRIVIARRGENNDVAALLGLLIDRGITFLTLAPSLLRLLVEEERFETCRSLRHVTCFGEPLRPDLEERFCSRVPADLSSFYGTTEASSLCLRHCRSSGARPLGNLGWRLGNWELYVLDAHLRPVPIGVAGELLAGGPKLAEGYRNRQDLTDERFLPHPFRRDGARLYRTGDRVRWRPDGSLEFMGRLDDQIKVRGYRVEPAEVEGALLQHSGVREAAVATRPNRWGESQLVAFLVPRDEALTVNDLRSHLRTRVPAQMVPTVFLQLEGLPRRPNGKLDRRGLADAGGRRLPLAGSLVAPRTPLEQQLASVWCGVLEIDRVGVHDDFFLLGGNSLLAARFAAQWRSRGGTKIALRDLFQSPTITGIAALLEGTPRTGSGSESRSRPSAASGNYCEVIRPGTGGMPVACIGDSRPIPFLLARLPADVPVLHAKLDGTHVWPPAFLSVEDQVEACHRALEAHCGSGPVVLVGFSYGGLLAHRLAAALLQAERAVGGVMLIEPSLPHRYQSFWAQWKWRLRSTLRKRSSWTSASGPASSDPPATAGDGDGNGAGAVPDIKTRWSSMETHYRRNVEAVRLQALRSPVALVGSDRYHVRFAGAWRRIEPGGILECVLTDADDHASCFREPHATRWLAFVDDWYAGLMNRDSRGGRAVE